MLWTCCLLAGCGTLPQDPNEPAIVAAVHEARIRWDWDVVHVDSANFQAGRWIIHISRRPETPGGHARLEVSGDGQILNANHGR